MRVLDLAVLGLYFGVMVLMGWFFSRRAKTTENYFVGGRAYSGWIVGVSMFGATISSITFVGYPADAYKTAYLRYVICLMLPVGVFLASRWVIPLFRRRPTTTAFEYLEDRFGPRTRVYGSIVYMIAGCLRISFIQFLVAILVNRLTGWDITWSILIGSAVTAYYTIVGGIEAVIWTDLVQAVILTLGGLTILAVILWKLPGGLGQLLSVAYADGKFMLGDLNPADQQLHPASWAPALDHKTILMLLVVGVFQWLTEYTTNQEVVQRYSTARSTREARRAVWLCCWTALPTWAYFMFIGTGLYVFYKVFPDPMAAEMLSGIRKTEEIVPYFVTTQLPMGLSGIVVAAVLAAAMSSMSSALNSISAVAITDIYRRHLAPGRTERHYVTAARTGHPGGLLRHGGRGLPALLPSDQNAPRSLDPVSVDHCGWAARTLFVRLPRHAGRWTRGGSRARTGGGLQRSHVARRPGLAPRRLARLHQPPLRHLLHGRLRQPADVRGGLPGRTRPARSPPRSDQPNILDAYRRGTLANELARSRDAGVDEPLAHRRNKGSRHRAHLRPLIVRLSTRHRD